MRMTKDQTQFSSPRISPHGCAPACCTKRPFTRSCFPLSLSLMKKQAPSGQLSEKFYSSRHLLSRLRISAHESIDTKKTHIHCVSKIKELIRKSVDICFEKYASMIAPKSAPRNAVIDRKKHQAAMRGSKTVGILGPQRTCFFSRQHCASHAHTLPDNSSPCPQPDCETRTTIRKMCDPCWNVT